MLFRSNYLQIDDISINGESQNPIRVQHENPVLNLYISGELRQDVNMAVEFRLTDKNALPLAFFSPSHYKGVTPIIRQGRFEINEQIHLPETLNQGVYVGNLYLSDPGKMYHLQMPNAVQIEYEGFPMETGMVFNYNQGSGLLFLK